MIQSLEKYQYRHCHIAPSSQHLLLVENIPKWKDILRTVTRYLTNDAWKLRLAVSLLILLLCNCIRLVGDIVPVGAVACDNKIVDLTERILHGISVPKLAESGMCQYVQQATVIPYQDNSF